MGESVDAVLSGLFEPDSPRRDYPRTLFSTFFVESACVVIPRVDLTVVRSGRGTAPRGTPLSSYQRPPSVCRTSRRNADRFRSWASAADCTEAGCGASRAREAGASSSRRQHCAWHHPPSTLLVPGALWNPTCGLVGRQAGYCFSRWRDKRHCVDDWEMSYRLRTIMIAVDLLALFFQAHSCSLSTLHRNRNSLSTGLFECVSGIYDDYFELLVV